MGPLEVLGELMYQSHAAYGAVGLASGGTDRLVRLVREHERAARRAGRAPALYGGKITGGGCGGAVCVLGLDSAAGARAVAGVARRYARETGHRPLAFCGSSDGAVRFGGLRLRRAVGGGEAALAAGGGGGGGGAARRGDTAGGGTGGF
jgi:L-arabinokinase